MKILIFCNSVPYNLVTDRDYKQEQLITALKENHQLVFISFSNKNIEEYSKRIGFPVYYVNPNYPRFNLNHFFTKNSCFVRKYSKKAQKEIDSIFTEHKPDFIIYNSVSHYQYIRKYENIKKIYNCTQVTYMLLYRIANQCSFLKKFFYQKEGSKLAHIEKKAYINNEAIIFSNISDINNVGSQMQLIIPLFYIPFYIDNFEKLPLNKSHKVLIGANYNTVQGRFAFDYFMQNIHPYLKKRMKNYELYIFGDIKNSVYKDNNIHIIHSLNDEILSDIRFLCMSSKFRSDLHLLPIYCMAKGIPIVGFTKSMEFINVKIKDDYCISASNLKDLIDNAEKTLQNDLKLSKIVNNAHNYAKEHYNEKMFTNAFKDFEEKIIKNHKN